MPFYNVVDTRNGNVYGYCANSKSDLKRSITRFDDESGEYCSFWDFTEISEKEYRKLERVPNQYIT